MPREKFTAQERADMVHVYFSSGRGFRRAVDEYARRFPDRVCPNFKTISRVVRMFRQTGSVTRIASQRRPVTVRTSDTELDILLYVLEHPKSSVRQISAALGISRTCVWEVLKTYKFRPFRAHLVQGLREGDNIRRLMFLAQMEVLIAETPNLLPNILWTDEAKFTTNGLLNRWNFRHWAQENPHITFASRHQVVHSINVWCGLLNNQIIGPYYYEENLNGERFANFLEHNLPDLLDDVPLEVRQNMYFQLDGCPAHNARAVKSRLDGMFPGRWIGNKGPILWPPRSPDLTPLDFFLWGCLKDKVYSGNNQITSLPELRIKIESAFEDISSESITNATQIAFLRRAAYCINQGGGQFEQFL